MKNASQIPIVVLPVLGVLAILAWGSHSGCKDRGDPARDSYNGPGTQSTR